MAVPIALQRVRFKRCPQCGDVVILTSVVCPTCDRSFQTTGHYRDELRGRSNRWESASPYLFSFGSQFEFNEPAYTGPQPMPDKKPIAFAALGLAPVGMFINQQSKKAVLATLAIAVILAALYFTMPPNMVGRIAATMVVFAIYVVGLIDVIGIATRHADNEQIGDWDWF